MLKLHKYARTVKLDSTGDEVSEDGGCSILYGTKNDPAEDKTLKDFIQSLDDQLDTELSPRSKHLYRGIGVN